MLLIFFSIGLFISQSYSYPSGAPAGACQSLSPERGHGSYSKPVEEAPFYVVAHGKSFKPGDRIGVEVFQRSNNANFKGFIVQALNAETHQPIGQFLSSPGMKLVEECSAVTHSDAKPKKGVNLVWSAQVQSPGEVIFRATLVQNKQLFYSNILAYEANQFYS